MMWSITHCSSNVNWKGVKLEEHLFCKRVTDELHQKYKAFHLQEEGAKVGFNWT